MPNLFATCIFAVIDPLLTVIASVPTTTLDYIHSHFRQPLDTKKSDDHDPLTTCRYRIDDSPPSTITLPDSRLLSYATYGSSSSSAHPVFFLHGWPGSRTEATLLDQSAQKHNIRLIAIDRPGIGSSTPDPKRTILSLAKDIENLADQLKINRYGVLGVSGGGPYALACAKTIPANKLAVVSIVVGLGPSDIGYWGMYPMNYLGWNFSPKYLPYFTRWWFSREPIARLDLSRRERFDMMTKAMQKQRQKGSMSPRDLEMLGDEDVMKVQIRLSEDVRFAYTPWLMQDMRLLGSDFGFKVEDIRKDLRVQMWYGRKDGNVPFRHGVEVARRLRSRTDGKEEEDGERVTLRIGEDDTHATMFFDYKDEYLGELAKAMSQDKS